MALKTITNTSYTITVSDTAANIGANFDGLNGNAHLSTLTMSDAGTPTLMLTATQVANDGAALGKITNSTYTIAVLDTAANVLVALASLNANSHLSSITLSDATTPILTLSTSQLTADAATLAKIASAYAITVADTASNVLAAMATLNANAKVTTITLTDAGTPVLSLSAAQVLADAAVLAKITNAYKITLTDGGTPTLGLTATQAAAYALVLAKITSAYTVTVSDTAANVATNIVALNATPHLSSIALSDTGTPAMALTALQVAKDTVALKAITNTSYTITVSDTAANIGTNFDGLNGNTHLTKIGMTDAGTPTLTLNSTQISNDGAALGKITNTSYAIAIVDTAANVVVHKGGLNGNAHVSSITLTDAGTPALALNAAQVSSFSTVWAKIVTPFSFAVSDTAANVAAAFDALNKDGHTTAITLTDTGTPVLKLTAAQGSNDTTALGEIANGVYAIAYSGVTGLGYSSYEDLFSGSHSPIAEARDLRVQSATCFSTATT